MDTIFGFPVPKYIEKGYVDQLCTKIFFSCNAVIPEHKPKNKEKKEHQITDFYTTEVRDQMIPAANALIKKCIP